MVAEVLFVFDAVVDDAVGEEEEVGGEGEGAGAGDCCGDGEIQSCNGRGNAWT